MHRAALLLCALILCSPITQEKTGGPGEAESHAAAPSASMTCSADGTPARLDTPKETKPGN